MKARTEGANASAYAYVQPAPGRAEIAALVALAARRVAPLWPLQSAIAVNPLSGFEEMAFDQAVARAAAIFGARDSLSIETWRNLVRAQQIDIAALKKVAIARLGGLVPAFAPIGPDVSRLDLLMARLMDLPPPDQPATAGGADPGAALIAKWCAVFFDQGQAACAMPGRDLGLYRAVVALIGHDRDYRRLAGDVGQRVVHCVPRDPLDAIAEGVEALKIPSDEIEETLAALVARLPGWAGHIRWRSEYAEPSDSAGAPAGMADLLALWILLERAGIMAPPPALWPAACDPRQLAMHFGLGQSPCASQWGAIEAIATVRQSELAHMFMVAAEQGFRDTLIPALTAASRSGATQQAPDAQLVFCIDVRSEPFRRALEAQGAFETFGYAGFFGLPIARHRHDRGRRQRLLPVLLAPQHDIAETPVPGYDVDALVRSEALHQHTRGLLGTAKHGLGSAFATAEALGLVAGGIMAARTLAPRLMQRVMQAINPDIEQAMAPALDTHALHPDFPAFTLAEKIGYASLLFRMTGMSKQTARLVVLTGHGGAAVNNPYAAALDCGACGGHPGGFNARVMAAILNDPAVREGLADEGLSLPATTLFLAAEHNTTTDQVTVFDIDQVPLSHKGDLAALRTAFDRAGQANRTQRAIALGRDADDLITGSCHWGEVRPEWGLARNAAFVVGPRWLTRARDLGGRAFLHSYDWTTDPDGTTLAMILTAPMVVAQWINCQYLFSTIDNHRYGSGDKTTQNPVGRIGVVQGNGGDLRIGLPRQSLFSDDGSPYHIPQRLLTVVHAPFDRVEAVVTAHDILSRLFGNGWVQLVAIDPATGDARRWAADAECAPNPPACQENRP